MKRIATIALFSAISLITAGSAMAQDLTAKAEVPFNFNIRGKVLPAGDYLIDTSGNVLTLREMQKKVVAMVIANRNTDDIGRDNVLVFRRYGNQYFLHSVRAEGAGINASVPTTKEEKWAKAQRQEAVVRENQDVTIALNEMK